MNTIEGLTGGQSTPLLCQTPGGTFVRLGEAMLDGSYIGTQLLPVRDRLLQATFVPQQEGDVNTTAPFTSPWRTVTAGDLGAMIEGSMTENVSDDPAGEEDYSWVEAGASSWSWIIASSAWNPEPQHDPEIIKEYIDLAAEMGWKYYIMDAGWQPQSTTGDTSYEGYYDWIDEIVAYANERNVGLIAWVLADDLNTPEKRLRLDDWAAKGIKGIKVDFFDRETQDRLELQETIYEYCADLGLVVNAHGTNKPTGEVRTNPNVLTREAIRGREYGGLSVEQYTMLAYTRTAIGPADVTETVYPAGGETAGFMNALPVLVQSGIHCFAGAPEDYLNSPVYTLYKDIPVAWDDTRLVDGYPGDFVALMRRSGEKWYGAAISVEARTVEFPLDMLGEGDYYALIYKEGESRSEMALAVQKVTREDVLQVPVMENGGCAVKVVKELPSGPETITLSEEQMTLEEKETRQLTAEITPADAEIKQVFWTSSDESVATVSADGTVTGVGEGLAVITAVSAVDPSVAATCAVRVTGPRYTLNADQWSVIRENADTRRFADENTVEITMEMGDLGEPEDSPKVIKNLFYLTPEAGDFTITAKVGGGMTMDYQTVALVAFLDDSHLVGTMRRHHSGFGGNVFDHMTYLNGYNEQTAADPNWQQDAWLKLEKRGSTFVSSYSYDGQSWTEIAQVDGGQVGTAGPDTLKVGVYASVGSGENAQMVMPISDFTYAGPDGTAQPIPFAVDNGEPSTPEKILEEAKAAAEKALESFEASNETTADDILAAVTAAVDNPAVTVSVSEGLALTPATDEAAGSITGQISLTYDGEEALVEVDLVIAKLDGPDPVIVPGDLDKDGEVTIADVMEACKVMARESAGTDPKDDEIARGDLDGDEEITIADVMEICKILARQG